MTPDLAPTSAPPSSWSRWPWVRPALRTCVAMPRASRRTRPGRPPISPRSKSGSRPAASHHAKRSLLHGYSRVCRNLLRLLVLVQQLLTVADLQDPIDNEPVGHHQPRLDDEEVHRLYPLLALAVGTGMRQGELLGLQW